MGIFASVLSTERQAVSLGSTGLGMPANRLHQKLEAIFIAKLFDVCEEHGLDVMPEGKNKDGENATRIADVLIANDDGDAVVVIEVCASETYSEAKRRIIDFFDTNRSTMKEGFIYNFSKNTWDYYLNGRHCGNGAFCKVVNRDLKLIVENSKVFRKNIE